MLSSLEQSELQQKSHGAEFWAYGGQQAIYRLQGLTYALQVIHPYERLKRVLLYRPTSRSYLIRSILVSWGYKRKVRGE
jgi:hypothetical protein